MACAYGVGHSIATARTSQITSKPLRSFVMSSRIKSRQIMQSRTSQMTSKRLAMRPISRLSMSTSSSSTKTRWMVYAIAIRIESCPSLKHCGKHERPQRVYGVRDTLVAIEGPRVLQQGL